LRVTGLLLTPILCTVRNPPWAHNCKALLDHGADVDALDGKGRTALFVAAHYNHLEVVKVLMAAGVYAYTPRNGRSLLHMVAGSGNTDVWHWLWDNLYLPRVLEASCTTDVQSGGRPDMGLALLLNVVNAGTLAQVQKLLQSPYIDVNQRIESGWTAMHTAAIQGRVDIVEALIAAGADLEAQEGCAGKRPLHVAAATGSLGVVKMLLEAGANVHALDGRGRTPHALATSAKHAETAAFLIRAADRGALLRQRLCARALGPAPPQARV